MELKYSAFYIGSLCINSSHWNSVNRGGCEWKAICLHTNMEEMYLSHNIIWIAFLHVQIKLFSVSVGQAQLGIDTSEGNGGPHIVINALS